MGTLVGHVAPGFGFLLIGLWHLYNNVKLYSLNPKNHRFHPWYPAPRLRHLELLLIAAGSCASIAMELFIGPARHQPLDPDFTIPSNHLHNFEHASISLTFLFYAAFAFTFDRIQPAPSAAEPLTIIAASAAFAQQLFLFHLHSADHMGIEGQYHWLLQLIIAISLITTLMGIGNPKSFTVGFVRSVSIGFQGIWFIVMGYALWTPALIPKGCFMNAEDGHFVVRCRSEEALHRAKSLANIEFSWCLAAVVGSSLLFYLLLSRRYAEEMEYSPISKLSGEMEIEEMELEEGKNSFLSLGKVMRNVDLESSAVEHVGKVTTAGLL
ncbi:transmembrane protein 45A-like [Phalaenopsis equestris]|uniref:transmembrane protein 45A-like n=1 Tax=Phalaenopsis equestris TaxID=78828 RepID=UPI0009E1A96E|nr:transmembrane protein 45A-like [Phalaenopsis equestris]